MTSLISASKQIPANAGYFITLSSINSFFLTNSGTDAAPTFVSGISSLSTLGANASTLIQGSGKILRDHGKTLISSGRTFRKVQVMVSTGSILVNGTDGVSGGDGSVANTTPYLTGYIELPGTGGATGFTGVPAPVARLG